MVEKEVVVVVSRSLETPTRCPEEPTPLETVMWRRW
jgi:hypothetical protein